MSIGVYLLAFAVVAVASTTQNSIGMGYGLIAAPLLRIIHPDLLPGPLVFAGVFVSIGLAMRNSNRADVVEIVPAMAGRFVGLGVALALLVSLSEDALTLVIAVLVLAFVCLRLVGLRVPRSPRSLAVSGAVSGVGGTIASLGGAPMALLYEQHARARDFRGPMGAYLAIGGVISVLALIGIGELDLDAALLGLGLLPPVGVGWLAARWVTPIVDRGLLGPLVLGISAASAIALIATELI